MSFRLRGFVLFVAAILLLAVSERAQIGMLRGGMQTSPSTVRQKSTEPQTAQNGDEEEVQPPIHESNAQDQKKTETAQNGEEEEVQLPVHVESNPKDPQKTAQTGEEEVAQLPIHVESNVPESNTEFRFCTKNELVLCKEKFEMEYWCEGPHYNEFGSAMRTLAATLPKPMGRRAFPVNKNKHVLIVGNSHTRQMIWALVCQYSDEVVEYEKLRRVMNSFMVRFRNNSTITSIINSPVVYSPQWQALLEKGGLPLQSFDGIVLGKFNLYADSKGTSFIDTMNEALKHVPGDIQYSTATAPTLSDVASVFDGPIVYVGMFAKYGQPEQMMSLNFTKTVRGTRDNLWVIDGRKYINKMKMECGASTKNAIGRCLEMKDNGPGRRSADDEHRCIGDQGGHPDLIAWEVAEKLNSL